MYAVLSPPFDQFTPYMGGIRGEGGGCIPLSEGGTAVPQPDIVTDPPLVTISFSGMRTPRIVISL